MPSHENPIPRVDFEAPQAKSALADALHRYGYARLEHHPLSPRAIAEIHDEWLSIFESPAKHLLLDQDLTNLAEPKSLGPLEREFIHITRNSSYPSGASPKALSLLDAATELAATLLGWLEQDLLRVGKRPAITLARALDEPTRTRLRFQYYHPIHSDLAEHVLRSAPHVDLSLLTLLPTAKEPGLEVCDPHGVWHSAHSADDAILVNAGQLLERASDGHYRGSLHRVGVPSDPRARGARLAMIVLIQPPDHAALTPEYTVGDFIEDRIGSGTGFQGRRIL